MHRLNDTYMEVYEKENIHEGNYTEASLNGFCK